MKIMIAKIIYDSPFASKSFFKFGIQIENYMIYRGYKVARRKESFAKMLDYQLNQDALER